MSEPDDFDALLKARFDQEHRQLPADAFVATTWRKRRAERRVLDGLRVVLGVAALLALVVASPWLIAGAKRLSGAVESSLTWTSTTPGAWMLAALAIAVVVLSRVRRR